MKFSKIKKDYLIFSKKERNASLAILLFIAAVTLFPTIENLMAAKSGSTNYLAMQNYFESIQPATEIPANEISGRITLKNEELKSYRDVKDNTTERKLFQFDPNRITKEEWMELGIKEPVAQRIINYRNKGGVFRVKEDLLKTYGFSQDDFNALKEYIAIQAPDSPNENTTVENNIVPPAERKITEVNSATIEQLTALGFSADVAARIIHFRDGLGGIYSVDQLNNVYGINPDELNEVKQFLIIDQQKIRLVNLNSASYEQLSAHTYISEELAKAIVAYRESSGRFVSVSELMKVKGMYPSLFEKLKPYLTI